MAGQNIVVNITGIAGAPLEFKSFASGQYQKLRHKFGSIEKVHGKLILGQFLLLTQTRLLIRQTAVHSGLSRISSVAISIFPRSETAHKISSIK